jgi:hypothetical protein
MMKTVKHTIYSIGDQGSDLVRTIGSDTVDLARRFGDGASTLAKRIGPKRGLIGLVVIAAAIGGSIVLVRYLRGRKANSEVDITSDDILDGVGTSSRHSSYSHATPPMPGAH